MKTPTVINDKTGKNGQHCSLGGFARNISRGRGSRKVAKAEKVVLRPNFLFCRRFAS